MGKVSPIRADQTEEAPLPPFTVGIVMNLSGERQLRIDSPSPDPISKAEANRRMDALMHVAERQRSLIEIRVLEEDLASKRAALADVWVKRKEEAQAKHAAALAQVEKDAIQAEAKREKLEQDFITVERDRGKTGDIKLVGGTKNAAAALDRDIAALRDRTKTLEAEHLQNIQVIDGNVEKLTNEIAAMERLLAKHRETVG